MNRQFLQCSRGPETGAASQERDQEGFPQVRGEVTVRNENGSEHDSEGKFGIDLGTGGMQTPITSDPAIVNKACAETGRAVHESNTSAAACFVLVRCAFYK